MEKDVRNYDQETFQEVPIDVEDSAKIEEEWIRKQSYGGSPET